MKIDDEKMSFFYNYANDIINDECFLQMKKYPHHKKTNCFDHSISVAINCYCFAKKKNLNVDYEALIRGALLHDYYLYNWHDHNKGFHFHGFVHAKIALKNANKKYDLTKKEKNMILSHMWPLNLFHIPLSKEAWILNYNDKLCTIKEILNKKAKNKV